MDRPALLSDMSKETLSLQYFSLQKAEVWVKRGGGDSEGGGANVRQHSNREL
jgi:hypothetical protein